MTERQRNIFIVVLIVVLIGVAWFEFSLWWRSRKAQPSIPPAPVPTAGEETIIQPNITSLDQVPAILGDPGIPPHRPEVTIPPIGDDEHIYGKRNTPFALVLYTDVANRYAKLLIPALRTLVDQNGDRVNFVYRHLPQDAGNSSDAAQAAECVWTEKGEKGFWAYIDATNAVSALNRQSILQAATAAGATPSLIDECITKVLMRNYVLKQGQDGYLRAKITVSPSIIVLRTDNNDVRLISGLTTPEFITRVMAEMERE